MTIKSSREYGKILGVKIGGTPRDSLLRNVREKVNQGKKFYIVTPNPEIVLQAQKDRLLLQILNNSDISLPDGIGLAGANYFLSLPNYKGNLLRLPIFLWQGKKTAFFTLFNKRHFSLEIIKGRQFFLDLISLANKMSWRVFFLGGAKDVAAKTEEILRRNYKSIKIDSAQGPVLNQSGVPVDEIEKQKERDVVLKINAFKPDLLFIGFGPPKEQKWLNRLYHQLDFIGAMMFGGTFDYVSGEALLPPNWVENLGLEWLWRLFREPRRFRRIINATVVFPWRVFLYKLRN